MKRLIVAGSLIVGLSACSPWQVARSFPVGASEGPRSYDECMDVVSEGPEEKLDSGKRECYEEFQPFIQEDDPEWECSYMGNKICGPGKG